MDRGSFSNSRRARHFGRSTQSFQSSSSASNIQRSSGSMRDSYPSESRSSDFFFGGSQSPFMSGSPLSFKSIRGDSPMIPSYFDDGAMSNLQIAGLSLDENNNNPGSQSSRKSRTESRSDSTYMRTTRLLSLPQWALDENREIRQDLTLQKVVDEGLVLSFSMDKAGCHFLQSNYYGENTQNIDPKLRERISAEVLGSKNVFLTICKNSFGNFFLQRVIEYSTPAEQESIKKFIVFDITALCLDKSACRVVQTALEKLEPHYGDAIVAAIPRKNNLMAICTDRNANHVIQKIIKKFAAPKWEFLVSYLVKQDQENLLYICRDKYGCRVVQTIVEVLSVESSNQIESDEKNRVLRRLMTKILAKCSNLAHNEFANYIIQHIIESPGILSDYRNAIIETVLLRNLLSMSQEKYASHVIERAFVFAPLSLIAEMMEEIFDGYVPHPDTGKDALDILMFHQFGNYVIQRMLQTCVDAVTGHRETHCNGINYSKKFEAWLNKLYVRVRKEKGRLTRFSSGKKMLDILQGMEKSYNFTIPYEDSPAPSSTITPRSSRRSSVSSNVDYEFDFNNGNYPIKFLNDPTSF